MMILGERYDEYYGLDEYDAYDPFEGDDDIVTLCDINECSDCPRYGDDCDGYHEEEDDDEGILS